MIMRYHWGLAVGHVYSHDSAANTSTGTSAVQSSVIDGGLEPELEAATDPNPDPHPPHHDSDSDTEDPELGFEDREDDLIDTRDGFHSEDELDVDFDDDDLLVMTDEMYDLSQPQGYHD
jgi:hypothetical protein